MSTTLQLQTAAAHGRDFITLSQNMSITEVRVSCYNINSLGRVLKKGSENKRKNKIDSVELANLLNKNEIIFLLETWLKTEKEIDENKIRGFKSFGKYRKHQATRRGDGGILCFVNDSIQEGVSVIGSESDDLLWIKLDKTYFGIEKDLYICGVYISPDENNAVVYEHLLQKPFEILHEECNKYEDLGHIAILGDFNARISNNNCFPLTPLINTGPASTDGNNIQLPETMNKERVSADDKVNQNGHLLNDLCCIENLYILNGRCIGDLAGNFTSSQRNGSSVIDYAMVNSSLLSGVRKFEVCEMTIISDHCPIQLTINCNALLKQVNNTSKPEFPPQDKLVWDNNKSNQLEHLLKTNEYKEKFAEIEQLAEHGNIIGSVAEFESTIIKAVTQISHFKQPTKNRKKNNHIKLSQECLLQRTTCKQLLRTFQKARGEERKMLGQVYYDYRKQYMKQVDVEKDAKTKTIIQETERLAENGNATEAWKMLNQLKGKTKNDTTKDVQADNWVPHFSSVGQAPADWEDWQEKINETIHNRNFTNMRIQELDAEITADEVIEAIKNAKVTHSSGDDKIPMDVYKAGLVSISPCLSKIYCGILETGKYPLPWKRGVILPLHKKGDTSQACNYRGITLSSNVSKILSRILNARLVRHLEGNNLFQEQQAGFRSNSRTTNHAFTLNEISQQYLKRNKKLYCCFVDFKAAFDSIWREGLWFKFLARYGIGGNYLQLLIDMNDDIVNRVKLHNGFTQFFSTSIGVKQGDNLSPTLFALFLNDLPKLFSDTDQPARLGAEKYSCMMYADDLVLISETEKGLQSAVKKLEAYCWRWRLTVNITKTKVLVFNKGGKMNPITINFGTNKLENVKQYEYLGILFTNSGSMVPAMEQQYRKGMKAWYALTNAIPSRMIGNVEYIMRLFDALVVPVALYGSELWAFRVNEKSPLERLNLRMCKYVLGVTKRTSTLAVLGELGRHPMQLLAQDKAMNFWAYMHSNNDTLIGRTYQELRLLRHNDTGWFTKMPETLNNLGFGFLWNIAQLPTTKYKRKKLLKTLKQRSRDQFSANWHAKLNGPDQPKLRTYRKFKNNHTHEPYLKLVKNPKHRTALAKLRTSNHKLEIETQRYNNTPEHDRICRQCNSGHVETEEHFIFFCWKHRRLRPTFLNTCSQLCNNFDTMNTSNKLIWIMKSRNSELLTKFAEFCYEAALARD